MPGLGRHVEHDERSRNYPARTATRDRSVLWGHHAPVLDQGEVGACTGFALAQLLNTDPFATSRTTSGGYLTTGDALRLYGLATSLDDILGVYPPDDTGSSGLAVAKAGVQLGYFSAYRHAFGFDQFATALQLQPVIVGTAWHEDMFTPDSDGRVTPGGAVVGGHEYLALGIDYDTRRVTFLNSWGPGWGRAGRFTMGFSVFARLLADRGDATAPAIPEPIQPPPPPPPVTWTGTFVGTFTPAP